MLIIEDRQIPHTEFQPLLFREMIKSDEALSQKANLKR